MGWEPVDPSCKGGQILRRPVIRTVPSDWAGIPKDSDNEPIFGAGESFRLMFVTSEKRNGVPKNIATYNDFVQDSARSGWSTLRSYADDVRVLASTFDVHARDNTYTTGTGVPIYWINGGGQGGGRLHGFIRRILGHIPSYAPFERSRVDAPEYY